MQESEKIATFPTYLRDGASAGEITSLLVESLTFSPQHRETNALEQVRLSRLLKHRKLGGIGNGDRRRAALRYPILRKTLAESLALQPPLICTISSATHLLRMIIC